MALSRVRVAGEGREVNQHARRKQPPQSSVEPVTPEEATGYTTREERMLALLERIAVSLDKLLTKKELDGGR